VKRTIYEALRFENIDELNIELSKARDCVASVWRDNFSAEPVQTLRRWMKWTKCGRCTVSPLRFHIIQFV